MDDHAFADLLQRVRAGDQDAASEFVRRFEPEIRAYLRKRLSRDPGLRRLYDSADLCQSALREFFQGVAAGRWQLDNPDDLVRLLTRMARNKFLNKVKAEHAGKRDHRRLTPAELAQLETLVSPGPSPSDIVSNAELLEKLCGQLPPPEADLFERRRQGHTWDEIAAAVGGGSEALRKQLERALRQARKVLGLEEVQL